MALSFQNSVRFVSAVVDLLFTWRRLNMLENMIEKQYALADKETSLAESLFDLHKNLRNKDAQYFGIANGAKIYIQKYACAVATANTDKIRTIGRQMYRTLSATDMYSAGQRRDIIETSMAHVVDASSGEFAMAYRNEDNLADDTYLNKYKHITNSINQSSMFVATRAFASLNNSAVGLAKAAANSAEIHLTGTVAGFTAAFKDEGNRSRERGEDMKTKSDETSKVTTEMGESIVFETFKSEQLSDGNSIRRVTSSSNNTSTSTLNDIPDR